MWGSTVHTVHLHYSTYQGCRSRPILKLPAPAPDKFRLRLLLLPLPLPIVIVCQASETSNTLLVKHYDKVLQTACGFLPFWETCPFWNYLSCLTQKASCSQGWDSKPASPEIFQYLNRIIHLQKGLVRIRLTLCTDKPGVREVGRFFSLSQIQFSLLCPPFSMSRTQI